MRIIPAVAAVVFALSGCSTTRTGPALANCYSAQDATRYNHLYLRLDPSGSYSAKLVGDIAIWGTAGGHWVVSGNGIALKTDKAEGRLVGFAPTLHRQSDDSLSLPKGSLPFPEWSPLTESGCGP